MFKALGKVMQAETKEDAEEGAAEMATLGQPSEVTVVAKRKGLKWKDAAARDRAVNELAKAGYERVGEFGVSEMPGLAMLVLLHPAEHVFGVVCEMDAIFTQAWVDLQRYHADGTSVNVTNAKSAKSARVDVPGVKKVRMPGRKVADLIAAMRKERPADADVVAIKASEFKARFEKEYAAEMKFRKAKARGK